MLKQTIWPSNHTSHTKVYFNEFVANVLRDNIGILIFDPHAHRLLEAKHHTATAHFGTLTQRLVHPTVPKCALAVWSVASNSLHGGQK